MWLKKNQKLTDNKGSLHADNSLEVAMVKALNVGVKLDHIDFVEHGVRPVDEDYYK